MNTGSDQVSPYQSHSTSSAPPEIDPQTARQIVEARARLTSEGDGVITLPNTLPSGISPELREYLKSLLDSTALFRVVLEADASQMQEAVYLHAHAVATAIKLRRQGSLDPKLGEIAIRSLGQLSILAILKCEEGLGRYAKENNLANGGKIRPSELFACVALFVNRLLEAFGCELLFGSTLAPRNEFESKLAHAVFAHAMTHVCQSKNSSPHEAMSEIASLTDRVRLFDELQPTDWHKYMEGADKSSRRAVAEFVRGYFAGHPMAKMIRPQDPNDPVQRFGGYALTIGKRTLAMPGSSGGVFEEVGTLREKYHRILELQNFIKSQGYEGDWSVDASRIMREDKPVHLAKFAVRVSTRDGKTNFSCVATTEWEDSVLDPTSAWKYHSEQAAQRAAGAMGTASFTSADGNIHEASYRAQGKSVRRIRRTTEHLDLGDILSFRMKHDPAKDEGGRELSQKTSDVTIVLAALEAVARMFVRRASTPSHANTGRNTPLHPQRTTGSKNNIILSPGDALPPIAPYVAPKKPEEITADTAERADEAITGRTYTIPEEGWRASVNLLPEGHKPGERAHSEANKKRKPLEFVIISKATGETIYRPYRPGSHEELLRYRDEILREFPEADYEVRMQTYRRSTAEIREVGEASE